MDLVFYKLHCITEDYILINTGSHPELTPKMYPYAAADLCRRRRGPGAYGVIFLNHHQKKIAMEVYLANGEASPFRSNAVLCASRYLFDSGLVGTDSFTVSLFEKTVSVDIIDSANFRLSLGIAQNPETGQTLVPSVTVDYTKTLEINGAEISVSPVSFRETYYAHVTTETETIRLITLSDALKKVVPPKSMFQPVFLFIQSRDECMVRFVRNSFFGFDFSAAAAAGGVAGVMNGLLDREIVIQVKKQNIFFQWLETDNNIYITAAPRYVFSGNYEFEVPAAGASN